MNPLQITVSKPLDAHGVAYIRALHKVWDLTPTEISVMTDVPRTTVRDVLHRRTWQQVPEGLVSWTGNNGRPESETGCLDQHPNLVDTYCMRGRDHRGRHLWIDPWRTYSESTAWLALEMRAIVDEPQPLAPGPTADDELASNRDRAVELTQDPQMVTTPAEEPVQLVQEPVVEVLDARLQRARDLAVAVRS